MRDLRAVCPTSLFLSSVRLTVYPLRTYALDYTLNFSANHQWRLLLMLNQTNVGSIFPQIFVDTSATGAAQRFYRLREVGR